MRSNASLRRRSGSVRRALTVGAIGAACLSGALVATVTASASPSRNHGRGQHGQSWHGRHQQQAGNDGLGIKPGKIKHVWLIILENKSYDATFTGLNNNTYLWQTLPSQGALLKNSSRPARRWRARVRRFSDRRTAG